MLTMRDGVNLATDIYRPAENGVPLPDPVPTILSRTPYDKNSRRYVEVADYFVPRGYAVALQDLRGRGDSEGTGQYFHVCNEPEGRDGYDTIEWIGTQPWSNGKVGMVGSSFAALVQTRAAFEHPPHLTAIWPDVTPTNSYHHQAREGGAMALHMFWALYLHAQDAQEIGGNEKIIAEVWDDLRNLRQLLVSTPFQRGETALAHVPNLENVLFDYYHRGKYDEFWQQEFNDFERNFHRHADIPATFSDGWFDPYAVGMAAWGYPFNRSPSRPPSVFGRRPPRPVCPWAFQARGMPSPFGRLGGQLPRPSAGNEILETHRLVGHGQFEHAIKHHAAAAGAAAIEAEHELVEVVAHVGTVGGPLMRSQQPPLGQ